MLKLKNRSFTRRQSLRRSNRACEITEGLESRLLLATQIITPQIDNSTIAAGENVNITVQHSTDDDSKSRGISLNVHFDDTKLSFDPATQLTGLMPFGATLVPGAANQVVVVDESVDDGKTETNKQFTIGWTSQAGTFPDGTDLASLFTAQFTALAGFSGDTEVRFTRNGMAPGFDTETLTPAVITASVIGTEQQIKSDTAAKEVAPAGNVDIPVFYSTDDNTKTRGISLNVHFDDTKLSIAPATQITALSAFGATVVPGAPNQVVVVDETTDDGDPLTNKQFTISWTSQGGTFPADTDLAQLFNAQFTAVAAFASGSTNVNYTRTGAAPGAPNFQGTSTVVSIGGPAQTIRSDNNAKNVALQGNVQVPVLYSADDNAKSRGISLNVHFDDTKLTIDPATQIAGLAAFGATVVPGAANQVVIVDESIDDGDPLTNKQFTISWTSQAGTFPADTDLATLFTATFTGTAAFNSGTTNINYSRNGAAPGFPSFTPSATVVTAGVNTPPIARDDAFTAAGNTPVTGNVITALSPISTDTDQDGDPLTISTTPVTAPTKGSVVLMEDGSFTYSPNPDATGTDTFVYMLSDGRGGTDTATVTITFQVNNRAPVAGDDEFTARGTSPLTGNVIISNSPIGADFDEDDDPLTIATTPVTAPSKGTVVLMDDGSFTYTANAGAEGTDTFVYTLSDGTLTDEATVTITILPENRDPIANNDTFTAQGTTPLTDNVIDGSFPPGVDTDPDDDPLTIGTTPVTPPAKGTVVLSADGSFTYTANAGATGTDTFVYSLSDGNGGSATGTVTITLEPGGTDSFDFDVDQDGTINPFTDAVLIFAWMSAGTPDSVFQTFIGPNAPASVTPASVRQNLEDNAALFDIDGDGTRNPFQDAVLLFAALSSGTPDSVLANFISPNAATARDTPAEVRAYVSGLQPPSTSSNDGPSSEIQFFDPSEDDDPSLFDFENDDATAAIVADNSEIDIVFATANDDVSLWKGILGA